MNQSRRRLLVGVGSAAVLGLAGCTSARAGTPVSVPETYFQRSENGRLLVRATVSNPSPEPDTVVLTVTAGLGGQTLERARELAFDAHETRVVDVVFDVSWQEASQNLSVTAAVRPA